MIKSGSVCELWDRLQLWQQHQAKHDQMSRSLALHQPSLPADRAVHVAELSLHAGCAFQAFTSCSYD